MKVRSLDSTAAHLAMRTLAIIIAGDYGHRVGDAGRRESASLPRFGDQYHDLDVALANCADAGIQRVAIVTQNKAQALIQHVHHGWCVLRPDFGDAIEIWPAQRRGRHRYHGAGDAVYQNVDLIEEARPDHLLIVASNPVFRVDCARLLEAHVAAGFGATVACKTVPIANAKDYGVLTLDEKSRVTDYADKPLRPTALPFDSDKALVSIGIYALERGLLVDCLHADASDPWSSHDFGRDLLPLLVRANGVAAHTFGDWLGARRGAAGADLLLHDREQLVGAHRLQ